MIKSAIAAVAATPFIATAAFAGPYVNIESNSGFYGSDYTGSAVESHVGYEGDISENVSAYIQAGPAFLLPEGNEETDTQISGKVGLNVAATDKLSIYGEFWGITGDEEFTSNVKAGVKYKF